MKTCFTWKPDKPRKFLLRKRIFITLKEPFEDIFFKLLQQINYVFMQVQQQYLYGCDLGLKDVESFFIGPKGTLTAVRTPLIQ